MFKAGRSQDGLDDFQRQHAEETVLSQTRNAADGANRPKQVMVIPQHSQKPLVTREPGCPVRDCVPVDIFDANIRSTDEQRPYHIKRAYCSCPM